MNGLSLGHLVLVWIGDAHILEKPKFRWSIK